MKVCIFNPLRPIHTRACYSGCEFAYDGLGDGLGDTDGTGTIEIPLAIAPLPLPFDALLEPVLLELGGRPVGRLVEELLRLDRSGVAWEGERVCVKGGGAPAPLPLLLRTSSPSVSDCVSMNVRVGPAMTGWVARSCGLLISGWLSGVTQIATGPLMPWGTTHWLNGSEMVLGNPPTSIWQLKFCGQGEIDSGSAMP